jgi:hypothetical protein
MVVLLVRVHTLVCRSSSPQTPRLALLGETLSCSAGRLVQDSSRSRYGCLLWEEGELVGVAVEVVVSCLVAGVVGAAEQKMLLLLLVPGVRGDSVFVAPSSRVVSRALVVLVFSLFSLWWRWWMVVLVVLGVF